jgi:hypothetical protein
MYEYDSKPYSAASCELFFLAFMKFVRYSDLPLRNRMSLQAPGESLTNVAQANARVDFINSLAKASALTLHYK